MSGGYEWRYKGWRASQPPRHLHYAQQVRSARLHRASGATIALPLPI